METIDQGAQFDDAEPRVATRWTVWRQDDNGNRYEVSRHETQAEAEAQAAMMEMRGHKQTYWVVAG